MWVGIEIISDVQCERIVGVRRVKLSDDPFLSLQLSLGSVFFLNSPGNSFFFLFFGIYIYIPFYVQASQLLPLSPTENLFILGIRRRHLNQPLNYKPVDKH